MEPVGGSRGRLYGGTVTGDELTFLVLLIGSVGLDALVRPRPEARRLADRGSETRGMRAGWPRRSLAGMWLQAAIMTGVFGAFLALCGNAPVAAGLALALLALLVLVSNAKHAMLGEPLLFSDLALVGAIFRHPQFYLSAIGMWQRVVVALVAAVLLGVVSWLFVPALAEHLAGLATAAAGLAILALSLRCDPFRNLARVPDAHADVRRHGFLPTLLLYWLRWRESDDPPPCPPRVRQSLPAAEPAPELLIVIQCESFADPVDLFADPALSLPGLASARADAWQWGGLEVSGFGAYTMRTEYGALFGRDEDALGFRRYDPFLTALGEASYALPARLAHAGWRSLFVHPHDMRFYGRDRIMPAGGFAELVGEDRFLPVEPGAGRYVTDAAVASQVLALARDAAAGEPTFIYAVTIENHGPWTPAGDETLVQGYLRLVRRSDAMLTTLIEQVSAMARPAMLVFFGDHRPSIPGATAPGGARHTPYVMIRLDAAGQVVRGENRRVDLTPARLHHAVLDAVVG